MLHLLFIIIYKLCCIIALIIYNKKQKYNIIDIMLQRENAHCFAVSVSIYQSSILGEIRMLGFFIKERSQWLNFCHNQSKNISNFNTVLIPRWTVFHGEHTGSMSLQVIETTRLKHDGQIRIELEVKFYFSR
jgi:hypothetical protein